MNKKRLIIYLSVVFVMTYLLAFCVIMPIAQSEGYSTSMKTQGLVALCMFIPALGSLVARLASREGFRNMKLRPHLKGNIGLYAFSWFAMPVVCTLAGAVYFLLIPSHFDPSMAQITSQLPNQNIPLSAGSFVIINVLTAVLLGPIINFIPCLGEELGWRAYMMPKLLERMSFVRACLLGGIIWGLWHAPFIAMGHNYGTEYFGTPWLGIILMCAFCVGMGTILTWVSVKADSCIPAVVMHASLNAFAGMPLIFVKEQTFSLLGPTSAGIIGLLTIGLTAAILLKKDDFKIETL